MIVKCEHCGKEDEEEYMFRFIKQRSYGAITRITTNASSDRRTTFFYYCNDECRKLHQSLLNI